MRLPAPCWETRLPAIPTVVKSVAVGQLDGRTVVVSGSDDGTVRVWDAATGALVGEPFTGHTAG